MLIAAFVLFLITLIRTAWISPRAYINFRVLENWIHGYGLGFNVGERVLPVSQPIWLLLLGSVYWFALSILQLPDLNLLYYLSIASSILISLFTFAWLLKMVSNNSSKALIVITGLLISKAFIDYSTSGLENPLTHLLILLFLIQYARLAESHHRWDIPHLTLISLIGSLLVALQWEYFPLIGIIFFTTGIRLRGGARRWASWGILLLPLGLYLLFSAFCYGFPLPNMYVARFHAGLGWGRLARQGLMYLLNLIDFDPGSVIILVLGLLAVLFGRAHTFYPFVLGIFSSIALIVLTGGDSISGRLFSPLVFLSVLLLCQVDIELSKLGQVALLMIVVIGLTAERSPLRGDLNYAYPEPDHRGVFDDRGVAYQSTGLLRLNRATIYPSGSEWAGGDWQFQEYRDVVVLDEYRFGMVAYQLGPESYVLATTGISDPLLARLPTVDRVVWDLFSLSREIPENYEVAVLEDPQEWSCGGLADYYGDLRMIVAHPLFSKGRIASIWRVVSEKPSRSMIQNCQ
jgi:arabinofuranosyltransferase